MINLINFYEEVIAEKIELTWVYTRDIQHVNLFLIITDVTFYHYFTIYTEGGRGKGIYPFWDQNKDTEVLWPKLV